MSGWGQLAAALISPMSEHHNNQRMKEQSWEMFSANERLQNTAHQREVEDMKKAGLNPILSASGGSGAGSSVGTPAPMRAPQINMPDFMAYGVSLKQLEQKDKELGISNKLADSTIVKNLTDNELKRLEMMLNKQGMAGKVLGTEPVNKLKEGAAGAGRAADQLIQRGIREMIDKVKTPMKRLMSSPPSSGGELP